MSEGQSSKASTEKFNLPLLIFVCALCFFSLLYGIAAMKFRLFPARQLESAWSGIEALMNMEDQTLASSVNKIDEKRTSFPLPRTLDAGVGQELLLVTGGPHQDATHCPQYGCLAWITDRAGKVLHSWPLPLDALFKGEKLAGKTDLENFYPVGIQLQDDGSLIATFHARNTYPYTIGIAKIGWDGKLLWKHIDGAHHWLHNLSGGRVAAPIQVQRKMQYFGDTKLEVRCKNVVYDEGVRIYRPDGSTEQTMMMIDVLLRSDYPGLLYSLRDSCDPIHINSVDVVMPEFAANIPGATAGDLLVSLREASTIAIINPRTGKIVHSFSGRTAAQHSAHFLPDGSIVAFDNLGGSAKTGGSRILRINPVNGTTQTIFPTAASASVLPFFSPDGSNIAVSPDGKRLMISSKEESRDIEIDIATGKPLWLSERVMNIGPFMGKGSTPVAGYFKSYGTYYIPDAQARALKLK